MAPVNNIPKYVSYIKGYQLDKPVEDLLRASGVFLSNGGGLKDFNSSKNTF
jgi:hypothetical protein